MSFSIGQRLVSTPTSTHQSEPVGRARANAGSKASEALNKVMANYASAAEHCKQSLPTSAASGDQGLQNIKSTRPDSFARRAANRAVPMNRVAAELMGSNPISKPIKNQMLESLPTGWGVMSLENVETPVLETFNPGDTFDSATLPAATASSGNQALHGVKSQSSGWKKAVDDRVLPPNLLFDRPIGSHRSPELARGKMTVNEVKINTFSQLAAAKMPWHPEKSDVDSVFQKKQMPASFIDSSNHSYTPPPVEHSIEIFEMPKPQRAVFKNTEPAPEPAAGKLQGKTVKIRENEELAAGKLQVKTAKISTNS